MTNPPLKEPEQETKEREPTLKKETPTTPKPIISAPNTENYDKIENDKTPNHPIKEDDLQERPQENPQKENIEEKENLKKKKEKQRTLQTLAH